MNFIKIAIFIFFNRIILDIRIYISSKIFGEYIKNYQKITTIIITWLLSAWSLYLINKQYNIIDINKVNNLNIYYILSILWIPILHFIINKINIKYIYKLIMSIWISWTIVYILGMSDILNKLIQYYLIIGTTEEFIKHILANNNYQKFGKIPSDIILFGIIWWIWFWLIENLIYMYHYFTLSNNQLLFWIFTISRSIFWFLIHILFTWIFCFMMYYLYHNKSDNFTNINNNKQKLNYFLYYILSILIVWSIHWIYNFYIGKYIAITWFSVIFIWYIWLSYLFFISDRWYNE